MTPLESSEVTVQVVVSLMIVILTTPEVSFTLLENIYSTEAVFLVVCDPSVNELWAT